MSSRRDWQKGEIAALLRWRDDFGQGECKSERIIMQLSVLSVGEMRILWHIANRPPLSGWDLQWLIHILSHRSHSTFLIISLLYSYSPIFMLLFFISHRFAVRALQVNVTLKKPGTKLEHQGIKIELIGKQVMTDEFDSFFCLTWKLTRNFFESPISGQIELFYDRGNHHEFLTQLKELARHGDLIKNTSYPFEFPNVEKPYEVYTGSNVRLRWVIIAHICIFCWECNVNHTYLFVVDLQIFPSRHNRTTNQRCGTRDRRCGAHAQQLSWNE